MYKLLIVDNEHIVVDSLLHYFENHASDRLETAGAYSAREAMEVMEREKIDILLTDIRMPGMDGLQLQKEVSRHWPWCRTLFLTGFNEFEYIQEAMRGGGDDYLLKTEGNEAVLRAVFRVADALDHQIEVDELIQKVQRQYEEALPLLNHKLLCNLVEGRISVPEDLNDRFRQQKIHLSAEKIWPILVRLDASDELAGWDQDLLRLSIAAIAKEYLGASTGLEQIQMTSESLVWLATFGDGWNEHRKQVYLQGVIEAVQQQCAAKLGVHLSACMARETVSWNDLPECAERLKHRLNRSLRWDSDGQILLNRLIIDAAVREVDDAVGGNLRRRLDEIDRMAAYLEGGNRFAFEQGMNEILSAVEQANERNRTNVQIEAFHAISALLVRQINRWQLHDAVSHSFSLSDLSFSGNWERTADQLCRLADAVFDVKGTAVSDAENGLIKRINWAVKSNLGGDLSLNRLGDLEGVSASYLAKVYKSITGESLKGYISRMRLEKAQDLLRAGRLRNREVGLAIGFGTEQSFNRFFKTMCKMTPQEYKKSLE